MFWVQRFVLKTYGQNKNMRSSIDQFVSQRAGMDVFDSAKMDKSCTFGGIHN